MKGLIDFQKISDKLMQRFRFRIVPVALKYYTTEEEMRAAGFAVPEFKCIPCMAVGRAGRREEAIGITIKHFTSNYCAGIQGLFERDEKWHSAKPFVGRWNCNLEAAQGHHKALTTFPHKKFEAMGVAPLYKGMIEDPDAIIMFATPEQAFWILTSSVYKDYKKRNFSFCGESTCNDSWVKTAVTGEPGLGLGSYGERSYSGLPEDTMFVTMRLPDVCTALEGAAWLRKGEGGESIGYPIPAFSLYGDIGDDIAETFVGY